MILRYGDRTRVSTAVSSWLPMYPSVPQSLFPQLWLDASDSSTVVSSAGAVSQWNDKSGNGYNLTQSTGSAKPITGDTTVNGRNVLRFAGGDWMRSTGSTNLNVGNVTVFTVFGETASTDFAGIIAALDNSSNDYTSLNAFSVSTAQNPAIYRFERNGNSQYGFVAGSKPSTFGIYSTQAYSSGLMQSWYNGNTASSGTITGTFGIASAGFLVGARWLNGGVSTSGRSLIGSIAEIIIYPRTLNTPEMSSVHNYLKNKWGIA